MIEIKVKPDNFQDKFLFSQSKFPAMIAGVGTGKTLCLLTKIYKYCEEYPGTTALIVRKEFTDLRDSTLKDFKIYFECDVGVDKNYRLPNGSEIMFRHGDELNVLKNINLAIAGIEQAEEFDTDEVFQFLRDRLRQQNGADVRPLCVIANANGFNWVWKLWINGAQTINAIEEETGQRQYINGEYECLTANTFANKENLPEDFIADLKRKEVEAPNHFRQYVLNNFEQMTGDDYVFNFNELSEAKKKEVLPREGYGHRIMGYDIARYGDDKCACVGIEQISALIWRVFYVEQWDKKDLDYTTGRILSTSQKHDANDSIIDEDGMGAGPLDFIQKGRGRNDFSGFSNKTYPYEENKYFVNPRTEAAFELKELVRKGYIIIKDEELLQELLTLRYKFANDGRRILISKEEMRRKGFKSPNLADSCLYASTLIAQVKENQDYQYVRQPSYYAEEDPFKSAGIR